MSALLPTSPTEYDIARAEIDAWRGRCLDLFACGEALIAQTLQHASDLGRTVKLRHFASHRLDDLISLVQNEKFTPKQLSAICDAVNRWKLLEQNRVCLAHGVVTELLDRSGKWSAQFDQIIYKSNVPNECRRTFSKAEALNLEDELKRGRGVLSGQLGQVRKKIGT